MTKENKKVSLQITSHSDTVLSKEQQQFNKLVKDIEQFEIKNAEKQERFETLLKIHGQEVVPAQVEFAQTQLKIARRLAEVYKLENLQPDEDDLLSDCIVVLCDEAFCAIEPDEEQIQLYDSFSQTSYKEEMEELVEEQKDKMSEFLKSMGIDIDMSEFGNSPEDFAKIMEQIAQKAQNQASQFQQSQQESEEQEQAKPKRKTKKQEEKEHMQKLEEQLKLKSLRDIYIGLVKMLHPDGESDEDKRLEKEEIMKQVTTAYDNKDLPTLLKLELMWVNNESKDIAKLSAQKLKIYINFLRERRKELERASYAIRQNPRFQPIAEYGHLSAKNAFNAIQRKVFVIRDRIGSLQKMIPLDETTPILQLKKSALKFAKQMLQAKEHSDMMLNIYEMLNPKKEF